VGRRPRDGLTIPDWFQCNAQDLYRVADMLRLHRPSTPVF